MFVPSLGLVYNILFWEKFLWFGLWFLVFFVLLLGFGWEFMGVFDLLL